MGNGLSGIGIDVISGFVFHFCNLGSSFKTRIKMSILNNWGLRTGLILTLSVLATVGFWYGVSGAGWYWIAGVCVFCWAFVTLLRHYFFVKRANVFSIYEQFAFLYRCVWAGGGGWWVSIWTYFYRFGGFADSWGFAGFCGGGAHDDTKIRAEVGRYKQDILFFKL